MIEYTVPGYKPLCFISNELYLYRKGIIYVWKKGDAKKIIRIYPETWKEQCRITSRLFRCEPKYATPISDTSMLLVGHKKIILLDVHNCVKKVVASSRKEFSDPLNICQTNGKWIALWGDYGSNVEHSSVNIYGLKRDYEVEKVFSFNAGEIRHIHNIIQKLDGGYYIFTGDQENGAGIYEADDLFENVRALKIGNQKYRAVIGFDTPRGLLYATDAVNEKNYVYLLNKRLESEIVCELNGSCIYGTTHNNKFYFSTSVEPDENNRSITSWISRKRGKGILSDEVHVQVVDTSLDHDVILKLRKDIFPMKLFQYGVVQFPKGLSEELWCYPIAVREKDGMAVRLK